MTFDEAKAKAQQSSIDHQCDQYVNLRIGSVIDGDKGIVQGHFYVSDWYDADCTLAHFFEGRQHE